MYRNVIKRIYLDIIPDSGAKTLEKLDEMIRKSIEESKKRTEWPDPENYKGALNFVEVLIPASFSKA